MRNLIKTFILMLMLSFSHAAIAGDLEDGLAAYEKQDFSTALRLLTPIAEEGNTSAQFTLGQMYRDGKGVSQNYKTAVKWYTLSAEQGHAKAQLMLGFGYALGQGVAQDFVKAHMWFNIAEIDETSGAIKNRDIVAKKMTPAQIAEAQKAASLCIKQNFKNCD